MTPPLGTETIVTPEGLELHFQRATAAERLVALVVDLGLVLLGGLVLALGLWFTFGAGAVLLVLFLLRHGYFVWFETRWHGRTPGKRLFHLRVVRSDGGPLTVETVLARNLTREVELFLPLTLLLQPDALFADHTGPMRALATLWILGFLFFPLTNRHRLRIGDLLAGTRVVVSPRVALARDLADVRAGGTAPEAVFHFTPEHLSVYGEHELTVLEDVLRKARRGTSDPVVAEVCRRICRRIGWTDPAAIGNQHARFLRDFYAAQRQHLEHRLLLGKRRLFKVARPERR
ncbi:MAG: RDD family protein [Planctomycetes bacterium]|nr:RDD family protein [Planctomycetota bacterium]